MMHILPNMFDARYKNGIVSPKSAVDLMLLFGYKYVDKFYPDD